MATTDGSRLAVAEAKIHLWEFPAGTRRVVDLDSPYVQMCLASGHIVIVSVEMPSDG